ncbi:hypothetical protein BD413DRAFT_236126 [Trametes elegans]|nr:hypothetical protein BD413DRAFT_236126 [Trametes elegans]
MSSPQPKSCLKRHSFPSSTRPHNLEPLAFGDGGLGAVFESDTDSTSDTGSEASHDAPASESPVVVVAAVASPGSGAATPRARRKTVSFSEDDDVRVFYPVTDPLHKQARKQVARIFRACADALRIEPVLSPTESRRSSVSSMGYLGDYDDDE